MSSYPDSAFVELGESLMSDLSPLEFSALLLERAAELFRVSDAGLVSRADDGSLRLLNVTSQTARPVELFEVASGEGPCPDCCETGEIVAAPDLDEADGRWPRFVAVARGAGLRATYSIPMRVRGVPVSLGSLDLLSTSHGRLGDAELQAAQAFADIAGIGLGQSVAASAARIAEDQLRRALASRIVIEQAKGLLAERYQIEISEAFARLRRFSRSRNRRLSEVASDLVEKGVDIDLASP